ncbi:MAG: hypothetical protein NPIRA02_00630 [Nitrospirales bacterium]|nr:MAG: hypothetical protein NPIRA02_00630 [Nitrospirales bacterium]
MSLLTSVVLAGAVGLVCQQPADLDGHVVRIPGSVQWGLHDPAQCHWRTAPDFSEALTNHHDAMTQGSSKTQHDQSTGDIHEVSSCLPENQVVRETLYFDFDSAYALPSQVMKLLPLARETVQTMSLQGYTDRHGPQSLNDRLAHDRARSAWEAWKDVGGSNIDRQLTGRGLCCYRNKADDAVNRRVELTAVVRTSCPRSIVNTVESSARSRAIDPPWSSHVDRGSGSP